MTPRELQEAYKRGENISALLRSVSGRRTNTEDIIEVAYDLQAGSYIATLGDAKHATFMADYAAELAGVLRGLDLMGPLLEAGVGEATTLAGVVERLGRTDLEVHGFDLSWSRIQCARSWVADRGLSSVHLCTGSLMRMPYADGAMDIVFTSHAMEPNGGQERPILEELHRVARRHVVLLEPAYELAGAPARAYMEKHGYCRRIRATCDELGYRVVRHELLAAQGNPLNPTALIVIAKDNPGPRPGHTLACPRCRTRLERRGDWFFSPEALVAYPVLGGIPCLRVENGIVASRFPELDLSLLGG